MKLINSWARSLKPLTSIKDQYSPVGMMNDELFCVFYRLEVDIFTWHEAENVEIQQDLADLGKNVLETMPESFSDLKIARKYFDVILREVDSFIRSWNGQLWACVEEHVGLRVPPTRAAYADFIPSAYQRNEKACLQQGLSQWLKAFQHHVRGPSVSEEADFLVTKALSLRQLCSFIALSCCFGLETSYDSFIDQFREAVLTAQILAAATVSEGKMTFVIWSLLVRSLYFVVLKCRDSTLRREAITILQSLSRQEGLCKCLRLFIDSIA